MVRLRFPHIVPLLGVYWREGGGLALVMELLDFGSVSGVQARLTLPPPLRARLLHQVGLGMNYLHGCCPTLLHLDLNPRNILLDAELHAKIADFGLSKLKRLCSSEDLASVGGTLEYLPPECLDLHDSYKPAPSTDVYSFGIVTWSILTGKHPYGAPNDINRVLIKVLIPQNQRPDLQELPGEEEMDKVDVLKALMIQCWHNDPSQRPGFSAIVDVTGDVYHAHRPHVPPAVHRVIASLNSQPTDSHSMESFPSPGTQEPFSRTAPLLGRLGGWESPLHLAAAPPSTPAMLTQVQGESGQDRKTGWRQDGNVGRRSDRSGQEPAAVERERESEREGEGKPPPLATSGTSREIDECSERTGAERKIPQTSAWAAGKISILSSRITNVQMGSGNTMSVIQKYGRRK